MDLIKLKQLGGITHREYINGVFEQAIRDVLNETEPEIDPITKSMTSHLHDGDKDFTRNEPYDSVILDSVNKLLKEYKSNKRNLEEYYKLSEDTESGKILDQATDFLLIREERHEY